MPAPAAASQGAWLPGETGVNPQQQHRNLCRPAHRDRQLASGPACPSTSAPASAWPVATHASSINFRPTPHAIFNSNAQVWPTRLVINLQPEDGLELHLLARAKDNRQSRCISIAQAWHLCSWTWTSTSASALSVWARTKRLLLDVIDGRLNLFVRSDEQEEAWRWVEPMLEHWAE